MTLEYSWYARMILLCLLALLILSRCASRHAVAGGAKYMFLSNLLSCLLLASSLVCFVRGVSNRPGWLTNAEDWSDSLSGKINDAISEGITLASKGNYIGSVTCYARAQSHLRQQETLVLYLRGTAELWRGDYTNAFKMFDRMFVADSNFTYDLLFNNGSFIIKYYLCGLSGHGSTAAGKWLMDVRKKVDGESLLEVRQYVAAFVDGQTNQDAADRYALLHKNDWVEINHFRAEERRLLATNSNLPTGHKQAIQETP